MIRAVRLRLISKEEGLKNLEKLANVMWLSVNVYEKARKIIEKKIYEVFVKDCRRSISKP